MHSFILMYMQTAPETRINSNNNAFDHSAPTRAPTHIAFAFISAAEYPCISCLTCATSLQAVLQPTQLTAQRSTRWPPVRDKHLRSSNCGFLYFEFDRYERCVSEHAHQGHKSWRFCCARLPPAALTKRFRSGLYILEGRDHIAH